MLIDSTQVINDLDGNAVTELPGKDFTFGRAAANALLANYPEEANLAGADKLRRFQVAAKVYPESAAVELADDEVKLLRERVERAFSPLIVGRVVQMLTAAS